MLHLKGAATLRFVFVIAQLFPNFSGAASSVFLRKENIINKMAPNQNKSVKKLSNTPDASVLTELKNVIKEQALEIERLKKKSNSVKSTPSSAHGAPDGNVSSYLQQSFLQVAITRVSWLSIFLVSLSLTAVIVNGFEHTLSRQIELAFFMPLLMGHGGNTGGQTVGTILSALSAGSIKLCDAPRVVTKEALQSLTVGCFLGLAVALVAHYGMGISIHVSTVIMCTLPLMSAIASTLGSTIPFVCLALKLDPSIIAAPAMTSFVDVFGLLSYFIIANHVFHLFGLEL